MKGLTGKRVLITGGARGIGKAAASRFLEEGARTAVLSRNPASLEKVRHELPGLEAALQADVSRPDELKRAFQELDAVWDGVDILINNAGIDYRHTFLELPLDEWHAITETNLTGAFICAQEASRRMILGGGAIVNMASTNGLTGTRLHAAYNTSKGGLIELTRSMALELGPKIRVNAVCPGWIMTDMQDELYTPEDAANFAAILPLKRLGTPEDVASLCAFLASDEAAFITGQTFVIDGGELAGSIGSTLPD